MLVEQDRVEERRVLGVAEVDARRVAGLGRLARGDVRRDVRLGEVLEPLDHADDDREEDHRADRGQRHPAEPLQRPGAVELRRLVEVPRDVEDRREEDDHDVSDPPEPEQDERGLGPAGRVEPQRPLDPEVAERDVDRPGRGVEQVDEPERRRDRGGEGGEVEHRPEEARSGARAGEHQRHADREDDLERHGHGDQPQRVVDGRPDLRVGLEQVAVVREADPARGREQVVVGERQVGAHHEGVAEEHGEADEPRAHEQRHEPPPAPRRLPPRPSARGRQRASLQPRDRR